MDPSGSITHWLDALRDGDQRAARPLWEQFHVRLVSLARQVLRSSARRDADEEDAVQEAFNSFFQGVANGRFPRLHDGDDLWRLLMVLTARKAIDQLRRERRYQKTVTVLRSQALSVLEDDEAGALARVVGDEPTTAFATQLASHYEDLLDQLADEKLRRIAEWKLEGYANGEIAGKLGCSRRTVIRKLETIRLIWTVERAP